MIGTSSLSTASTIVGQSTQPCDDRPVPRSSTQKNAPFDGDLRRALLDAAIEFVALDDPANLSLRAIARQVGVSHAAPKNHFADKTAMLTAIAVEGFQRLGDAMIHSAVASPDPVTAVVEGGQRYVAFAAENPGYFRVMWRNELLDQADVALADSGRATFEALTALVVAAQEHGWAPGRSPESVAVLAWSTVHGLAQLHLDGPLDDMVGGDVADLASATTELLRDALAR